jgi:hypothetical protein
VFRRHIDIGDEDQDPKPEGTTMSDKLLLVGSIPLDTVEDVFETFGKPLGKFLPALPDGEVGPRRHWISASTIRCSPAMPSSRRCVIRSRTTAPSG